MEFSSGRRIFWVFCTALVLLLCSLNNNGGVEATHQVFMRLQSQTASNNISKLHRTGYHFQPPKHWINDPNGPMYYKGVYHLFYQYNPKGAVWGNIVWAHSVSSDLINWRRVNDAIYPSKPFDAFGCWSGSATVQNGVPTLLYTGIIDANNTQVQNYAIPKNLSDPLLMEWIKPNDNPLISADPSQNKTSFRDPTTAWMGRDGRWRIVVGSRRKNRGVSYMYRSKDFKKWIKSQHPLHTKDGTGNWECPDFFPVSIYNTNGVETSTIGPNVKHVFKVSLDVTRYEYYTIGTYITKLDRYIPDPDMVDGWNGLRYDYGNFYASKSFYDPYKQRRILWGWANESDSTDNDIQKGWAGIQLIPRTIVLDNSGKQLIQWPVEELETLRKKNVELKDTKLVKGEKILIKGITAAQADVDVVFAFDSLDKAETFDPTWDKYDGQKICGERDSTVAGGLGPFGLITFASIHMEEYTPVFFRIFKDQTKFRVLLCSDAKRSSLEDPKTYMSNGTAAYRPSFGGFVHVDLRSRRLSLRSLIDNSVVESFAEGGKTVITSRVYPKKAIYHKAHLYAFNNGSETIKIETLSAWSMRKPKEMNNNKLPIKV